MSNASEAMGPASLSARTTLRAGLLDHHDSSESGVAKQAITKADVEEIRNRILHSVFY